MTWEYHHLRRRLALPGGPLLALFEAYCERAWDAMDSMEWSWKFTPAQVLADRVFWLGAGGRREATARHLEWLAAALGLRAADHPGGLAAWLDLVARGTERALVAYAGPNPETGRAAAIKIYLTLDRDGAAGPFRHVPGDSAPVPPAGGVLRCLTRGGDGREAARTYLLFDQCAYDDPAVAATMTARVGARGLALARLHPRSGVAFKADGTDMLGLALRPTGAGGPHPAQALSPALVPLLAAARRHDPLHERLDRVTWITVPLDDDALRLGPAPREMNVYVRLR